MMSYANYKLWGTIALLGMLAVLLALTLLPNARDTGASAQPNLSNPKVATPTPSGSIESDPMEARSILEAPVEPKAADGGDPAADGLVIRVHSEGDAIDGAVISLQTCAPVPGELRRIGGTNGSGELSLSKSPGVGEWVVVSHPDYFGPVRRPVEQTNVYMGRLDIALERPVRISGFISNWSSDLVDRDLEVVAHPYLSPWVDLATRPQGGVSQLSDPADVSGARVAEVDASGNFELSGCSPAATYSLAVRGNAVVGDNRGPTVKAPAEGVPLVAYFVYGARVVFADADGAPVLWDVNQLRTVYTMNGAPSGCQFFLHAADSARWIDQEALFQGPLSDTNSAVFGLASRDADSDLVNPIRFKLPGEQDREVPVAFKDLGKHDIPVTEIRSEFSGAEAGSLLVRFPPQDGPTRDYPLEGMFYLISADEVATAYRVALAAGEHDYEIHGIPSGVYGFHMQFASPPMAIEKLATESVTYIPISGQELSVWEYSLPTLESVYVRVLEADGSPWFGPVSISQVVVFPPSSSELVEAVRSLNRFDSAPYILHAPSAAKHEVWISRHNGRAEGEKVLVEQVEEEGSTSIVLTLPPADPRAHY